MFILYKNILRKPSKEKGSPNNIVI